MSLKMNSMEKKWVLYDVGNSAFTLLVTALMSIYFNTLAEQAGVSETNYLAYWGYATSASTVLVAILGPTLGTLSDIRGMRRKIFSVSLLIGAVGCVVLGFCWHWLWFLLLFVLAKSAYQLSLVVYDSMLIDVTTRERMDEVSSRGYAWGYIGSCIPFVLAVAVYAMYAMFGFFSMEVSMVIVFVLTAVWWVGCSLPLWKNYRQKHFVEPGGHPVRTGAKNLGRVFKELGHNRKVLFFLIAFFFFIDGVYTIIDMAVAYGDSLGLNEVSLVLALLVTQVVAFPAAILFGMATRKIKPEWLIVICIAAYFCITVYAVFLSVEYQFWILAVCVGIFQGTIQAMSRSYYGKIIPHKKAGEYFGVYDIFGKGAAFLGTTLVSAITQLVATHIGDTIDLGFTVIRAQNVGVGVLAVMFILGMVFFLLAVKQKTLPQEDGEAAENAAPAAEEGVSKASAGGAEEDGGAAACAGPDRTACAAEDTSEDAAESGGPPREPAAEPSEPQK